MRRSIRVRLQLWYALVLLAVVGGFAGILYYRTRGARLREVDGMLDAAAHYIDADLRRFPPHELEVGPPGELRFDEPSPTVRTSESWPAPGLRGPPHPPPPHDRPLEEGGAGRPRPPSRERLLRELGPPPPLDPRRRHDLAERSYFAVWRADGSLLKAEGLPVDDLTTDPATLPFATQPRLSQRGAYREITMHGPGRTQILVGTSIQRERTELWAFAWQLAGASGVVLVVGLAGGWVVSARILKPLAAISATASAISETNLSERIDAAKVDQELSELAGVLNSTFARLESAFERQTRFTADASHELRTPLAIIRSHAELALARPRTDDEYREALGSCLRSAKRMARLVDALLILARADAGKLVKALESLDLRGVVIETANLLQPLAQAKGVCVHIETAPAYVVGDADRLAQVVTNLMTNAIDYNRPGGEVRVRLRTESAWAVLSVEDTGQGIPEEDCAHIFERFYRVDKARSRASGGHGLGLAICKSIVEAHGGKIDFESRPAHGSIFRVHLPCSAALWEAPE